MRASAPCVMRCGRGWVNVKLAGREGRMELWAGGEADVVLVGVDAAIVAARLAGCAKSASMSKFE